MKSPLIAVLDERIAKMDGVKPEQVTDEYIRGMRHFAAFHPEVPGQERPKKILEIIERGGNPCLCGEKRDHH